MIPTVIEDEYGFIGPPGVDGKDGRNGFDGQQGPRGFDGVDGFQGVDGAGFRPVGDWKLQPRYQTGDVVSYQGNSFVAVENNAGRIPGHGKRVWQLLAARGADGADGLGARGHAGIDGTDGSDSFSVPGTFDSTASIGQPLYVTLAGPFELGNASLEASALVLGLVSTAATAGNQGEITTGGILTQSAWTAVTGSALLTTGAEYFLSQTSGMLTTVVPTNLVQASIGRAVNPTSFSIEIQSPLLRG